MPWWDALATELQNMVRATESKQPFTHGQADPPIQLHALHLSAPRLKPAKGLPAAGLLLRRSRSIRPLQ